LSNHISTALTKGIQFGVNPVRVYVWKRTERVLATVKSARHFCYVVVCAGGWACASAPAVDSAGCALQGEPIHWIADYCMASIGTDDEIAASDCIAEQSERRFENECAARVHFKRAWCEQLVASGARTGSVDECVVDAGFAGRTVVNGGVGGP
jgi:hypothetical protein